MIKYMERYAQLISKYYGSVYMGLRAFSGSSMPENSGTIPTQITKDISVCVFLFENT